MYVYPNLAENTRGLGIGGSAGTGRDGIPGFRVFQIIDPLVPKDMFRLVCLVKLVFFAREGVAF